MKCLPNSNLLELEIETEKDQGYLKTPNKVLPLKKILTRNKNLKIIKIPPPSIQI